MFIKGTSDVIINEEIQKSLFRKNEEKIEICKIDHLLIRWTQNMVQKDMITKTTGDEVSEVLSKGNANFKVKIYGRKIRCLCF